MSVHQDKSTGRWRVIYKGKSYRRDFSGNQFELKRQAVAFEAQLKTNDSSNADIFYYDLLVLYLDHKKTRVVRASYQDIERLVNGIIKPLVPNKRLSQLSPKDLLKFEDELTKMSYSTAYKNSIIIYLKNTFNFAIRYYGLAVSPARYIEKLKLTLAETTQKIDKAHKTWDSATFIRFYNSCIEEAKIASNTRDIYLWNCTAAFFLLSFDLGTRMGETNGLQVTDYDSKTLTISVHQQVDDKDDYKLTLLKTVNSVRTISISTFAAAELDKHIEYLKTLSGFTKKAYLCGGSMPLSPETLRRKKNFIIEKEKITPKLTIHEFRHSHATNLIDAGADITAVSRRLGHSSVSTTERVYVRALDKKRAEIARINDTMYEKK